MVKCKNIVKFFNCLKNGDLLRDYDDLLWIKEA